MSKHTWKVPPEITTNSPSDEDIFSTPSAAFLRGERDDGLHFYAKIKMDAPIVEAIQKASEQLEQFLIVEIKNGNVPRRPR